MVKLLRRVADSVWFQHLVLAAIVLAGVLVGLETHAGLMERAGVWLHRLDRVILFVFVLEAAVKIGGRGARWWEYFRDPWNLFDFAVVSVCLLPFEAGYAAVLRLVRVLRVLRLVTALPRLQVLVGALLRSIPSMGYVALLLLLHFYIYAVMGVSLFGKADAAHFGGLGRAMLTLFQIVTLEGWADIMRAQLEGGAVVAWGVVVYFISFILLGTMIILNLLIGVIMNGMQEAQMDAEAALRARNEGALGHPALGDDLNDLDRQIGELRDKLRALRSRLREEGR